MKRFKLINENDNVAVVLDNNGLGKGESVHVNGLQIYITSDIEYGHKFAVKKIGKGDEVIKYGNPIGVSTADISPGEWVHSHNLHTTLDENKEYTWKGENVTFTPTNNSITFMGYRRKNGDVGIRNELWIIPTVGCVNGIAHEIVSELKNSVDTSHIDDICVLSHNYGCSQLGGDHANTRTALAALAKHPNAGGVLLLGLGCENNQLSVLKESMGVYDENRVKFLIAQDVDDEISEGIRLCKELVTAMKNDIRTAVPVSALRIGLKCGGSDGLSGITANPLLGQFSDWLISHGGTTVLTEVPEMFGAEQLLMNRASDKEVFENIVSIINNFKDYFRASGMPIYENPSPGNKKGGITTLEEKSLGCVQKGGSMPIVDVLKYGETIKRNGLNILQAPGNDLVASTALVISGCQIILFTTGRGTPFGTIVPTLKISTNSDLAKRKPRWIDFDAGILVDDSMHEVLDKLISRILTTANGKQSGNEERADKDIAIFKTGVTL